VLALLAQGCGTILYGTRQEITISSTPPEAEATVDGVTVTTPAILSLKKNKDYAVTVKKEGYQEAQAQIKRSLNGWTTLLGNIVWYVPYVPGHVPFIPGTYAIAVLIDLLAGGGWTLEPDAVNVTLEKKDEAEKALEAPSPPAQ